MNNFEFKHWRERLGLTQKEAGVALGISTTSVELYERGSRRDTNDPVEIPPHVEYACVGLSLIRSAQNGNVMKATPQVRTLARDLMYFMSLGTSIANNRQSKFYDTWHEGLRETGEIPKNEMSLLEMLFPYAKPGELRQAIWALGNKDAIGPANEK
ncbi:helix-turn-helix protein [Rhizobium sp. PP-F2F-G38]|nr:helix-turn-helix protein [Rhizobium sp. PP-WC-1G-195]PYE92715.1 helix-turn-helix protein [Rhizobium sp. PP-F2F-G38]TCP77236.1 helix-turn-helix protein [Rhizobium sp. PP-CC-2G-626]TCQ03324.1 helix-turn-helix protein [Rhizobium sp. PP-F2F-G36]